MTMACSSGTSSGTSSELQGMMDQRKRKRMISNRESARRSRMRKQKHLDDLASQVTQLRRQNQQLLTSVNLTSHKYLAVEAENSVLRAQVNELSHRLDSLNQIIHLLNFFEPDASTSTFFNNPFNFSLPIMASADMLQYWDREKRGGGVMFVREFIS